MFLKPVVIFVFVVSIASSAIYSLSCCTCLLSNNLLFYYILKFNSLFVYFMNTIVTVVRIVNLYCPAKWKWTDTTIINVQIFCNTSKPRLGRSVCEELYTRIHQIHCSSFFYLVCLPCDNHGNTSCGKNALLYREDTIRVE